MILCKQCKYWTATPQLHGLAGWGWCKRTHAENKEEDGPVVQSDAESIAFADPGDRCDDESVLRCKPDFGCVQGES